MATAAPGFTQLSFEQVYEIIKNNQKTKFDEAYATLRIRSDYVSVIPKNETLAILHYLVVHNAFELFMKVIAIPKIQINILMRTAEKPSRDILKISETVNKTPEGRKLHTEIHRLTQLDTFLEYARRDDFTKLSGMLDLDPELVNQKAPYRRYYMIHHLAYANDREGFDKLHKNYSLNLTLLNSDQQTAAEVAFEQKHTEFGQYLESLSPEMRQIREAHEKKKKERTDKQEQKNKEAESNITKCVGSQMLNAFTCPLTKEVFIDPVVLSDGHTYERAAIQQWLDLGKRTSPMTNVPLTNLELVPNTTLKNMISEMNNNK